MLFIQVIYVCISDNDDHHKNLLLIFSWHYSITNHFQKYSLFPFRDIFIFKKLDLVSTTPHNKNLSNAGHTSCKQGHNNAYQRQANAAAERIKYSHAIQYDGSILTSTLLTTIQTTTRDDEVSAVFVVVVVMLANECLMWWLRGCWKGNVEGSWSSLISLIFWDTNLVAAEMGPGVRMQ